MIFRSDISFYDAGNVPGTAVFKVRIKVVKL